jgi:hypothetical protein
MVELLKSERLPICLILILESTIFATRQCICSIPIFLEFFGLSFICFFEVLFNFEVLLSLLCYKL